MSKGASRPSFEWRLFVIRVQRVGLHQQNCSTLARQEDRLDVSVDLQSGPRFRPRSKSSIHRLGRPVADGPAEANEMEDHGTLRPARLGENVAAGYSAGWSREDGEVYLGLV